MRPVLLALALALAASPAAAQAAAPAQPRPWRFASYIDAYLDPEEDTYFVPTVFADRGVLHLEARYNYENFETASFFAGRAFTFGAGDDYLKLTPMVGVFLGQSSGVAPGLEVEARFWRFAYWLESEYTFNAGDSSEDYFYTWSELNFYVTPWAWVGGSVQRLRLVETPREFDIAPMVGFGTVGSPRITLSLYAYGLGTDTRWLLATLGIEF